MFTGPVAVVAGAAAAAAEVQELPSSKAYLEEAPGRRPPHQAVPIQSSSGDPPHHPELLQQAQLAKRPWDPG